MLIDTVLFKRLFIFMCRHVSLLEFMHTMNMQESTEEGVRSPGIWITGSCKPLYRCWELNPGLGKSQ